MITGDTKLQGLISYAVAALISLLIVISIFNKHGSQPAALVLLLLLIPYCFKKKPAFTRTTKLWLFTLVWPIIASIPLFLGSGTGEALAAGARYLAAAICLVGLYQFPVTSNLIFRSASIATILAILFNLHQFQEPRVNWGIGFLESSYVAVMLLSLSLSQIVLDKDKKFWRLIGIIGSLCAITVAVKTGTRGAWPAIVVVCFLHFLMTPLPKSRKIAYSVLGIVVLVISLFTVPSISNRVDLTVEEVKAYYVDNNHSTSVGYRLDLWRIAIRGFIDSPIWGVSYNKRRYLMRMYRRQNEESSHFIGRDGRSSSHNEILNALSQRGLLGLASILLLYFLPFRYFVRQLKSNSSQEVNYACIGGIGAVVAIIICGLTEAPLMNIRVATTYGFTMVFLYHLISRLTEPARSHAPA
jgi:O-antigen ligase